MPTSPQPVRNSTYSFVLGNTLHVLCVHTKQPWLFLRKILTVKCQGFFRIHSETLPHASLTVASWGRWVLLSHCNWTSHSGHRLLNTISLLYCPVHHVINLARVRSLSRTCLSVNSLEAGTRPSASPRRPIQLNQESRRGLLFGGELWDNTV